MILATILTINKSIFFTINATEIGDSEYESMITADMVGTTNSDEFIQIEKSIEKPLMQKKNIKQAREFAKEYIAKLAPYDSNWKSKNPRLI